MKWFFFFFLNFLACEFNEEAFSLEFMDDNEIYSSSSDIDSNSDSYFDSSDDLESDSNNETEENEDKNKENDKTQVK